MQPEDALDRLGSYRRRFARLSLEQHRMTAIAFVSERFGGWIGKDHEVMRFLAQLSLCREKHLMSEGLFNQNWPHHRAGVWYNAWPSCRN